MFSVWSRQRVEVTADVMVIPRSRSWSIQSITAVPSSTSPIRCEMPEKNRIRSVVVVLPASMWAMMPRLRSRWSCSLALMKAPPADGEASIGPGGLQDAPRD
jgi:hypothetical protein